MGGTLDSSSVSIGGLTDVLDALADEFELFAFLPALCLVDLSAAPVLA